MENQARKPAQSSPVDPEAAFLMYLEMGQARSLRKLVDLIRVETGLTVSLPLLEGWSKRHGWQAKLREAARDAERQAVAAYIDGAGLATAKALNAIGSVMNLAESLMIEAAATKTLEIKTVDDLAKVGRLINEAAKLAEILQGRPSDRVETVATGNQAANDGREALALANAAQKLEDRQAAENEANPTQHIDSEALAGNGPVIDAEFVEVNQGDIESMFIKTVMRQPQPGGKPGQDQAARPPSVEEAQAQAASAE